MRKTRHWRSLATAAALTALMAAVTSCTQDVSTDVSAVSAEELTIRGLPPMTIIVNGVKKIYGEPLDPETSAALAVAGREGTIVMRSLSPSEAYEKYGDLAEGHRAIVFVFPTGNDDGKEDGDKGGAW